MCPQTSDESDNYHGFELCLVSTETEPAPEIPKKADGEEDETLHLIIIIVPSAFGAIFVCSAIYHYSKSKSDKGDSTSNSNQGGPTSKSDQVGPTTKPNTAGKIGQLIF